MRRGAMKDKSKSVKLTRGDSAVDFADKFQIEPPEMHIVGSGKTMYLWIGGEHGPCYAHVSGPKTLAAFARAILKAICHEPSRPAD